MLNDRNKIAVYKHNVRKRNTVSVENEILGGGSEVPTHYPELTKTTVTVGHCAISLSKLLTINMTSWGLQPEKTKRCSELSGPE